MCCFRLVMWWLMFEDVMCRVLVVFWIDFSWLIVFSVSSL